MSLGLDHDGNNHGTTPVLGVDPTPNRAPDHLLKRLGIPCSIGSRILECFHNRGAHVVEHRIIRRKPAGVNFWPHDDLSRLGIHRDENGDEPLFSENATILQVGFGNFANGRSVHIHEPDIELANLARDSRGEINDRAVSR